MKNKIFTLLILVFASVDSMAGAVDYFSKPLTRLDFAVYIMRQNADELFKYALEDNKLEPSVTSGIVTYVESPLEIRIYGRAWGFKESELTKENCHNLLKAYSKNMYDGTFWEKVGPAFRENQYKKAELGRQMSEYFVYEVFLGKEIPMDNKKRVQCSAKQQEIWPNNRVD